MRKGLIWESRAMSRILPPTETPSKNSIFSGSSQVVKSMYVINKLSTMMCIK